MILREQNWFSESKFDSQWANLLSKCLLTMNLLIVIKFCEQFSWALSNFFADVSSKIITLADLVLSQLDMKRKWFLLRPARIFPHSRFTTHCRTFQVVVCSYVLRVLRMKYVRRNARRICRLSFGRHSGVRESMNIETRNHRCLKLNVCTYGLVH